MARVARWMALSLALGASTAGAQATTTLSPKTRAFVTVAEPVVVLTNVTVIDGTGAAPAPGRTIVVRDGKGVRLHAYIAAKELAAGLAGVAHRDPNTPCTFALAPLGAFTPDLGSLTPESCECVRDRL